MSIVDRLTKTDYDVESLDMAIDGRYYVERGRAFVASSNTLQDGD